MQIVYKTARLPDAIDIEKGIPFVVSTASADSSGDTINQSKWDLRRFASNPIVLFNHQHAQPVGRADGTHVEGGRLVSRVFLAAPGTSPTVDMLRALVEQKIIRAVSAGFVPTKTPTVKRDSAGNFTGLHFDGQELVEISLCAVPSNPQTLAAFKSFDLPALKLFADPAITKAQEARERRLMLLRLGVSSRRR